MRLRHHLLLLLRQPAQSFMSSSRLFATGRICFFLSKPLSLVCLRSGTCARCALSRLVLCTRLIRTSKRTVHLNQEFLKHKEKLERLSKITATLQDESRLSDNLRERLEIAAYVSQFALGIGRWANSCQCPPGPLKCCPSKARPRTSFPSSPI